MAKVRPAVFTKLAVDPVVVVNHDPWLHAEGCGLSNLLLHPCECGTMILRVEISTSSLNLPTKLSP